MADHEVFDAGDVVLQSGETLPGCRLAYVTRGTLNADGSNAVLVFSHFRRAARRLPVPRRRGHGARPPRAFHRRHEPDGQRAVVVSQQCGTAPCDGPRFPVVTILDNVRLQHALVTERLGVRRVRLAVGHSMGAQQAFHWGALYPDTVERIAPICGSARTSVHNACFLEGMRAVLTADPAWRGGDYDDPPAAGLRAMARAWAPWPPSQGFLPRGGVPGARPRNARRVPGRLLGTLGAVARRQRHPVPDRDMAALGHRRQRSLRRGFRGGARRHRGARHRHARQHRHLLPAGRQRIRSRPHAERRAPAHPFRLGPLGGIGQKARGHGVHRPRAQGPARALRRSPTITARGARP